MPLYDYKCGSCGKIEEILKRSSDGEAVMCSACQCAMQLQVSAPFFRLKGGGWYETDFKSGNQRNVAGTSDASSSPAPQENKSESKSDKKSENKSSNQKSDGGSGTSAVSNSAGAGESAGS
ncbi:MAG: FmdB family zinc ribbon protein [Gammaproteobacteria bacterium]